MSGPNDVWDILIPAIVGLVFVLAILYGAFGGKP